MLIAQALKHANAEYCEAEDEAKLFFQARCGVELVQERECIENIVVAFFTVQTVACGLVIEETEGGVDYDEREHEKDGIFEESKK